MADCSVKCSSGTWTAITILLVSDQIRKVCDSTVGSALSVESVDLVDKSVETEAAKVLAKSSPVVFDATARTNINQTERVFADKAA
jgi:hypothetical protein